MKSISLYFIIGALFLLGGNAWAQDVGVKDTIKLEGGPLVVDQSVPLSLTIVNDVPVGAYTFGFIISTVSSGFAVYDSVVYVNRMADPAVFGFRIVNVTHADGASPDSILAGAYAAGLSVDLPAGNDAVMQLYFTGTTAGQMSIDSGFIPPAGYFILCDHVGTNYLPEFEVSPITVIEGTPLPTLTFSDESLRVVDGEEVSFDVTGTSPNGFPVEMELVSLAAYDDNSAEPDNDPAFGTGNPAEFSWTPAATDIGIWLATFRVTDSSGQYYEASTDIQVVESSDFLLDFNYSELANASQSFGLLHGNFDADAYPEIFTCGSGYYNVPEVELLDYDDVNGLTRVFSSADYYPRTGPQIGYFNNDAYLDGLAMRVAPGVRTIEVWYGDGNNSLAASDGYSHPDAVAYSACLGEFTGDSYLDYAAVRLNKLIVYNGSTTPIFKEVTTITLADTSKAVNAADFNDDGYDDLAVGIVDGVQIYLGNGSGGFTTGAFYSQTYGSADIVVTNEGSDFDNDGNFDLCISTPSVGGAYSEMVVYLGKGDGTFDKNVIRTFAGQIFGNCVGDFNDDGELDIACVNGARQYAAILFGDGDGSFTNELRFWINRTNPEQIEGFDIDLDGDLDLMVAANGLSPSNYMFVLTNDLSSRQFSRQSVTLANCNNAEMELTSPSGREFNRIRNTMPGSDYYRRNFDNAACLDEYATMELVEEGAYSLSVTPKPNLGASDPFTLEFEVNGEPYRLAQNIPMTEDGYNFTIYLSQYSAILPRPGQFVYANPPVFTWAGKSDYNVQVSSDIDFTTLVYDEIVSGNTFTPDQPLEMNGTTAYYWRVKPTTQPEYDCLYVVNLSPGGGGTCGDANGDGSTNVADVVSLVNYIFKGGPMPDPECMGDANGDDSIDVGDAVYIIAYIFKGGPSPVDDCCL